MVTRKELQIINRDGNASSPYEAEDGDDWRPEASYTGKDCDSFTSYKKRIILKKSWAMNEHMAICTCGIDGSKKVSHAILLVHIDGKIYVLDNRSYWIEELPFFENSPNFRYTLIHVPRFMQEYINACYGV